MFKTISPFNRWTLFAVLLVCLGCGGGGGGTGTTPPPSGTNVLAFLFNGGTGPITAQWGNSVQVTVRVTGATGVDFPDEVRLSDTQNTFTSLPTVTLPGSPTNNVYETTVTLNVAAGSGNRTGNLVATLYNGGNAVSGSSKTLSYNISQATATTQVTKSFVVTSSDNNTGITEDDYVITLTETLNNDEYVEFQILSPGTPNIDQTVRIQFPDDSYTGTVPKETTTAGSLSRRELEIRQKTPGGIDTVAFHGVLFSPVGDNINRTWSGPFTYNGQQGTLTMLLSNVDSAQVNGNPETAFGKVTEAQIAINHPDGNVASTLTTQRGSAFLLFRIQGTPYGRLNIQGVNHDTANQLTVEMTFDAGTVNQTVVNATLTAN